MPLVVRAFPVSKSLDEVRAFAAKLKERRSEACDFYCQYGVSHESWHVQETPAGPWIIVVNVVDDPGEAAPRYARASEGFDKWFKAQVLEVTGIDADKQPLGPPTTMIYDWSDDNRPEVKRFCDTVAMG